MYMGGDMLYLYMYVGYNVLSLQLSFWLYVVNKYHTCDENLVVIGLQLPF